MAIEILQKVAGGGSAYDISISATAAHNALVLLLLGPPQNFSVSDNGPDGGNTYVEDTSASSIDENSNDAIYVMLVADSKAGVTSVHVDSLASAAYLLEISGLNNTDLIDAHGALNTQAASTSPHTAAITTTGADLVIAALHVAGGYGLTGMAAGSPYTSDTLDLREYQGAVAHLLQEAAGETSAIWANSVAQPYCSSIVALKPAPVTSNKPVVLVIT